MARGTARRTVMPSSSTYLGYLRKMESRSLRSRDRSSQCLTATTDAERAVLAMQPLSPKYSPSRTRRTTSYDPASMYVVLQKRSVALRSLLR